MSQIPPELIAQERELLARLLSDAAPSPAVPLQRKIRGLRKVSQVVERTSVSAGCFGETIQWRLKAKKSP